ncbi:MAG: hypothetical protein M3253_01140 [Chloroflexota bacterium]|nr:hypothetical protein [Chloroflexota bacterium]
MKSSQRSRDTLTVLFALTGGAWAWTAQLWLGWLLGEPACYLQPGDFSLLGFDSSFLWLLIGGATGALALAALFVSYRLWRRAGGRSALEEPSIDGPRRFLVYSGLVLNLLFVLTIVMGASAPLFQQACI